MAQLHVSTARAVCSNDHGYDPLLKHLCENGISIKRLGLETHCEQKTVDDKPEAKTAKKPQKQSNLFETDEDYKKAFGVINGMTKNRPRTLDSLERHLNSHFHETVNSEKIKKIINEFKKRKYIEVENEKITYNL